jgi:hypothetical protein
MLLFSLPELNDVDVPLVPTFAAPVFKTDTIDALADLAEISEADEGEAFAIAVVHMKEEDGIHTVTQFAIKEDGLCCEAEFTALDIDEQFACGRATLLLNEDARFNKLLDTIVMPRLEDAEVGSIVMSYVTRDGVVAIDMSMLEDLLNAAGGVPDDAALREFVRHATVVVLDDGIGNHEADEALDRLQCLIDAIIDATACEGVTQFEIISRVCQAVLARADGLSDDNLALWANDDVLHDAI